MNLDKVVKKLGFNRVKIDEPMREYTQMKVGGPADLYYEAVSVDEITEAVKVAIETKKFLI